MPDTPEERRAAVNLGPGTVLPAPDGSIDADDRAHLADAMPRSDIQAAPVILPPQARTLYARALP